MSKPDDYTPVLVKRDGPRGWHRINKKDFVEGKHEIYVPPPPAPAGAIPPPPPVQPDPIGDKLAALAKGWQKSMDFAELRDLASAIAGRMPENREQAVAIVSEKLAGK